MGSCIFNSTAPSLGDSTVALLNKWLQSVGGVSDCGSQSEWFSLAMLVTAYGGQPSSGDTIADLWEKIRIAVGDDTCRCGDNAWQSARRILDTLSPGSFRPGDSLYNILWRILQAVNATPVPPPVNPCCPPPIGDWGSVAMPPGIQCDFDLVSEAVDCAADWGSV